MTSEKGAGWARVRGGPGGGVGQGAEWARVRGGPGAGGVSGCGVGQGAGERAGR